MDELTIQEHVSLAPYTSFGVGGNAEYFSLVKNADQLEESLKCTLPETQLWMIGYGSNCLISDKGLLGMTICARGGEISIEEDKVIADAGAWWDDVVVKSIDAGLWGVELMSEIPGSVGGSTFINITAYGQSLGERVQWIDVWDRKNSEVRRLVSEDLEWGYKTSIFQDAQNSHYIVLRVCLQLSGKKTTELQYQKAIDVADELNLNIDSLSNRRDIIIEARKRAGSLWHYNGGDSEEKTVGSFFRNPKVSREQAEKIIAFDESGKTAAQIKLMNKVHGGDEQRVSAAHVMLAAGFKRGQTFAEGRVKLNEKNLLKIEALKGATAQDIYDTMRTIQVSVEKQLSVKLEPEARILGEF